MHRPSFGESLAVPVAGDVRRIEGENAAWPDVRGEHVQELARGVRDVLDDGHADDGVELAQLPDDLELVPA